MDGQPCRLPETAYQPEDIADNGTLAFTKIGNRTYYRQEDVERVIVDVEERRKEAKWKGKGI